MAPKAFLGVDGGGSKTQFVLVDDDGHLLASVQGAGSYHLEIGMEGLRQVLAKGVSDVLTQAAIEADRIAHAFFGIPAYGEDSEAQVLLDAMPEALLGHRRYRCGNDMVCAWAGSLAGEDGINIVAGTGSIGYGERRGKAARAGGWGEVFGDEGSAYWIAVQGLNVFTRMSDGRLPKDALYALFRDSLRLGDDLDLCARVLNNHSRDSIAAVAKLVTRATQEGDAAAIRIFDSAANELAAVADAIRLALDFAADEIVPVSYSGGVFHAGALILDPFKRHLAACFAGFDLRAPVLPPSIGAAIYAAKLATSPFSSAALRRLHDASASAG
jgi:N-acetylglucosamine kinase-like BadF-type ATPase